MKNKKIIGTSAEELEHEEVMFMKDLNEFSKNVHTKEVQEEIDKLLWEKYWEAERTLDEKLARQESARVEFEKQEAEKNSRKRNKKPIKKEKRRESIEQGNLDRAEDFSSDCDNFR